MLDYSALTTRCLESRVDWLTCTSKDPRTQQELTYIGEELCQGDRDLGDRLEQWGFQGYRGYQTHDCRYGLRQDGTILILSQEVAHAATPMLAKLNVGWSRIDYCVTVCDPEDRLDPFNDYWACYPWTDKPHTGHPSIDRRQRNDGGCTVTLGSRASSYYSRIYNKHVETHGEYPKGSWRWEVELKGDASQGERKRWQAAPLGEIFIRGIVAREMGRLQLPVPWRRSDPIERWAPRDHKRDADRSLEWLASQVAPCVQWLRQSRGDAAVIKALGLETGPSL